MVSSEPSDVHRSRIGSRPSTVAKDQGSIHWVSDGNRRGDHTRLWISGSGTEVLGLVSHSLSHGDGIAYERDVVVLTGIIYYPICRGERPVINCGIYTIISHSSGLVSSVISRI